MEETRSDCGFTEEELRLIAIDLGLSRREGDVLILAFQNVKRDAMGPKLAISRGSVNTYSARLHRKMNVNCRTELMKCVMDALMKRRAALEPGGGGDHLINLFAFCLSYKCMTCEREILTDNRERHFYKGGARCRSCQVSSVSLLLFVWR